jgi:hypothetical protein
MKINKPGDKNDYLLKVEKHIYGLKDAERTWAEHLCDNLLKRGFKQSAIDQCLFYQGSMILVRSVDGIIALSLHSEDLEWLEASFAKQTSEYNSFEFTVEGEVTAYLGIIVSYEADGAIHLKQLYLIKRICEALGVFDDQKWHDTPADPSGHAQLVLDQHFKAGYCICHASMHSDPRKPHFGELKQIVCYLATTANKSTIMNQEKLEHKLIPYCNANFMGNYCKEYSDDPHYSIFAYRLHHLLWRVPHCVTVQDANRDCTKYHRKQVHESECLSM